MNYFLIFRLVISVFILRLEFHMCSIKSFGTNNSNAATALSNSNDDNQGEFMTKKPSKLKGYGVKNKKKASLQHINKVLADRGVG